MKPQELMLASSVKDIDLSKYRADWVLEEKFDGIRIQAIKNNNVVRLFSRNTGIDGDWMEYTNSAKEIVEQLSEFPYNFHLDGEMIYENDEMTGEERFSKLCSRLRTKYQTESMFKEIPLTYKIFDALNIGDTDLKYLTYDFRLASLNKFMFGMNIGISKIYHRFKYDFQEVYDRIISEGKEGCVLKKLDSVYEGKRSKNWLKVLPEHTEDYNVIGFTKGTGRRLDSFGALICELPNSKTFHVGTGYDDEMLAHIKNNWLGKKFVIEVSYKGLHPSGIPRMPVFQRLRFDKVIKNEQRKLW